MQLEKRWMTREIGRKGRRKRNGEKMREARDGRQGETYNQFFNIQYQELI